MITDKERLHLLDLIYHILYAMNYADTGKAWRHAAEQCELMATFAHEESNRLYVRNGILHPSDVNQSPSRPGAGEHISKGQKEKDES